jgi:BolA protein
MSNEPGANKNLTGNDARELHVVPRAQRIARTLNDVFSPEALEVEDESAKHKGHAGARPEGETHFKVTMTSAAFTGRSRVERHRMVTDALADEFARGLHALALKLKAAGE